MRGAHAERVEALSLRYTPPEVVSGKYETSPKIDVWSLGIILHALVSGALAFKTKNKEELQKAIITKEVDLSKLEVSEGCKDLIS